MVKGGEMKMWHIYSLLCLLFWGVWGVLGKLACRTVPTRNYIFLVLLGNAIVLPLLFLFLSKGQSLKINTPDRWFALSSSMAYVIGGVLFFIALSKGETTRVVLTTAMYPIITIIFAVLFLNEPMSVTKGVGVVTALVSIVLLSI